MKNTATVVQGADGIWRARVTIQGRQRCVYLLHTIHNEKAAKDRAAAMAELARRLRKAGQSGKIDDIMRMAAVAKPGRTWDAICSAVDTLCSGNVESIHTIPTFKDFAIQWVTGKLHKRYPDHIKDIDQSDNEQRLREHVYPLIGHVTLDKVSMTEADIVMASLSEKLSPATRRHVAQVMRRVLELAVFPARIIAANPLPRGYLPKITHSKKASAYLYPAEEAKLVTCDKIPFSRRLLWAVLAREGMRAEEAAALRWLDVDLDQGLVHLDENKTDDPRSWALDQGVAEVLRAVRKARHDDRADAQIFASEARVISTQNLARQLRKDLTTAGVDRPQLFEGGKNRMRLRAHDLRATFITLALASGRSETWVQDRTGHTTSAMINRYRRQARGAAEVNLGWLQSLPSLLAHDLPTLSIEPKSTTGDQ